jgi:hypothetical protein
MCPLQKVVDGNFPGHLSVFITSDLFKISFYERASYKCCLVRQHRGQKIRKLPKVNMSRTFLSQREPSLVAEELSQNKHPLSTYSYEQLTRKKIEVHIP